MMPSDGKKGKQKIIITTKIVIHVYNPIDHFHTVHYPSQY